jgi:hypothetical protein
MLSNLVDVGTIVSESLSNNSFSSVICKGITLTGEDQNLEILPRPNLQQRIVAVTLLQLLETLISTLRRMLRLKPQQKIETKALLSLTTV